MEINLPDLNEQFIAVYESGLSSSKVTQFFAELPMEQAIFFSLIFLPFFLLGWLFLFRLFEVGKGSRRWLALGLVFFYFASIGYLKMRGQQKMAAHNLRNDVTYYMMDNFIEILPCDSLCTALKISNEQIDNMKYFNQHVFAIIHDEVHIKDPKILAKMNERMDQLEEYVLNTVKGEGELTIEAVQQESKDFGKVSTDILKDIVANAVGEIELDVEKGKIILPKGVEPPSGD